MDVGAEGRRAEPLTATRSATNVGVGQCGTSVELGAFVFAFENERWGGGEGASVGARKAKPGRLCGKTKQIDVFL